MAGSGPSGRRCRRSGGPVSASRSELIILLVFSACSREIAVDRFEIRVLDAQGQPVAAKLTTAGTFEASGPCTLTGSTSLEVQTNSIDIGGGKTLATGGKVTIAFDGRPAPSLVFPAA